MELKPGYKQTEIGVIPDKWRVTPMKDLFALQNGVNSDKSAYGRGIPFVNVLEVITHSTLNETRIPGRISLPDQIRSMFRVQNGDVLFNRTSETQEELGLASVYLDKREVVFGGFVIRARPTGDSLHPIFSSYALRSSAIRQQIISRGQGAVRANIGQQDLSKVRIAVPPFGEQEAIAGALTDADVLIESLEQLIAKKRLLKQGAMQELLRPKEAWVDVHFGSVAERIIGGGTPSRSVAGYWNGEIPWMTVKDFAKFSPFGTVEYITREGLKNSASKLIPRGTLITSTRMGLGKAVVFQVYVSINQDLKAIFPKKDIDTLYLYYWFQSNEAVIAALGSGSTVMGVSLAELKSVPFSKPPIDEQTSIAAILSDMDAEIAALEAKLAKTRLIKQGVMENLLTGKIRLI